MITIIMYAIIIAVILASANNPFDKEGVVFATLQATVSSNQNLVLVSTDNIGDIKETNIDGVMYSFVDESELSNSEYHRFARFNYTIFGFNVEIEHNTQKGNWLESGWVKKRKRIWVFGQK